LLLAARRTTNSGGMIRFQPTSLTTIRTNWAFGKDAIGAEAPDGGVGTHPDDPELNTHDGPITVTKPGEIFRHEFYYREPPGPEPLVEQRFARLLATGILAWFFYNFYHHSDMMFGEFYIPYLEEFTDAELGIPPDDAPDPAYWGHHGEPYKTY